MHGGFSLKLSEDRRWPRVQVRHLSKNVSLIRFVVPRSQPRTRCEQRRDLAKPPARRGYFCDLRGLAGGAVWRLALAGLAGQAATHRRPEARRRGTRRAAGRASTSTTCAPMSR